MYSSFNVITRAITKTKQVYHKAFHEHLFATNIVISCGLSGVGDMCMQVANNHNSSRFKLNTRRTTNMMLAFGLTSGVMCHHWYLYLDSKLPGRAMKNVMKKLLFDQIFFSPVLIGTCLILSCLLEKKHSSKIAQESVDKGWRLYLAEWFVWPPAQFINFYFLPTHYRVLYDTMISLGFDVYTSHVKHGDSHLDDQIL